MNINVSRLGRIAAIVLLALSSLAFSQTSAKDLRSALPAAITPGVNISYAAGSGDNARVNEPSGMLPVKTYIFTDAEKFYLENDLASFFKLPADHPKFFELGTEFKIWTIEFGKKEIQLTLVPQTYADSPGAGYVGAVKVMLGAGYQAKTSAELVAIINQMLKVGSVQTLKIEPPSAKSVTLDCVPTDAGNTAGADAREVILDEAAKTATFEMVGSHRRMQPAIFTDAEIKWENGASGDDLRIYALNRSTGIMIQNDRHVSSAYTMHFNCSVRSKKF